MSLPDFLLQDADGSIRMAGHRIELWHLVHYYNEGHSPEMLAGQYPSLPLALIHKVIAYYLENRDQVDAYASSCRAEMERQRAEQPRHLDALALRQRLKMSNIP